MLKTDGIWKLQRKENFIKNTYYSKQSIIFVNRITRVLCSAENSDLK